MRRLFNVKCVMCNLILLYTLHFTHYTVYAQPISSAELINNAKLYDGKTVAYEGEAIGEVMARGEYAWINLNDGQGAIGVWLSWGLAKDIIYTGSYKSKGEWIEAVGVFQHACPQHGGDLDIHAQAIRKTMQGRPLAQKASPSKKNLALILLGLLCLILILRQFKPG